MIERRDLLRGVAVGATLLSVSSASACSYATFEDDTWGQKLIKYFRTGRSGDLDGLFQDFTTMVTFSSYYGSGNDLAFAGEKAVREALTSFRVAFTSKGWVGPRKLVDAKIVGNKQQGRMNKIELLFAEEVTSETSCGPDRSERRADIYFEAGVYDSGEDWVKWAIERIAIMPPLDTERFDG